MLGPACTCAPGLPRGTPPHWHSDSATQPQLCLSSTGMYQPLPTAPRAPQEAEGLTCKVLMCLPLRYKGKLTKLLYFVTTS